MGGGVSSPPGSGARPVLVCGNAACLPDDLAAARAIYPTAPAIAVNGACIIVPALAIFSLHPERLHSAGWIRRQRRFGHAFTVHASGDLAVRAACPWVDAWWHFPGGGGSAWGARKLAVRLGFDVVVLCGSPMVPGPYVGNHSIGGFMDRADVVDHLLSQIVADAAWHAGAVSMSGATRDLLGGPC